MDCGAQSSVANFLSNNYPSSLSSLNKKLKDTNRVPKRICRTDTNAIAQNFLLIWLDAEIDESSDDYLSSIKQLRQTVNIIETFRDTDECIDYISEIQNEKLFLIISGALCQTIVPLIHNIVQLYSIYVFYRKQETHEGWTKDWSKVKGIFTEITPICGSVQQCTRQCDENSILISAVSSLNQIEPSFMYTQLFKEIILEIDFDEKKAIKDLAEYAREKYAGNDHHLKIIDEFAREYQSNLDGKNKPIWWYTRNCFTDQMLNKALRTLQVETLLKMGIYVRDLHRNIKKLNSEQPNETPGATTTFTVYRGQTMFKEDFKNKIKQGGLISFNNFLSTSDDRKVALRFIPKGLQSAENNTIRVLFEMSINRSISSAPFARIHQFSYFKKEKEILFSMHTVFRVQQIQEIEDSGIVLWQVRLTFTSDNEDQQLKTLTKRLREESQGKGWERMGSLLSKLGENDKAEQLYRMLLNQASDETAKAAYYNNLGMLRNDQGKHNEALVLYQKALDIKEKSLSPNHSDFAAAYNNIALAYENMGEYSKAVSSYERSLEIQKIAIPPNHPDLASSYNNIGSVYSSMGEYLNALSSHQRSLEIRKIALPSNHPDLAKSYNNIGSAYSNMGEYSKALSSYERSLEIQKIALPPNHPDLASSYNNIGLLHDNMGEYSKALSYYEKAQEILRKSLPSVHPCIADVKRNIENVKTKK
ncbi:unnamed protein product [Rotaria sp. Silwood2]|nr:unnamed protein product [Rotaria sp. Silwood2]CAF4136933.1 unnamed protein product [Rotaria sp. Silwood2]